jgi:hypothetical protein
MFAVALIETRIDYTIDQKLLDHWKFLPDDWDALAVVSNRNYECTKQKYVSIPDINNFGDYNSLLTSDWFWSHFLRYERVLICHCDSGLLRTGIEEFLEWDHVGAPWKFQQHGGNGGLSLRNPEVMHEICKNNTWALGRAYEDVWFSNIMFGTYDLAPRSVCEKFSVETIYKLGTLGYHNIKGYLPPREVENIMSQYLK